MFWPDPPENFENELRERALPESRYLFFKKGKAFDSMESLLTGIKGTVYYGRCTHCGEQSALESRPTHNDKYTCPACGSRCIAKEDGRGAKHLYDDGGYNLIQRAGDELFITHYYVALDYRYNKYKPRTHYEATSARWRFSKGEVEAQKKMWHYNRPENLWRCCWEDAKSVIREKYRDNYTEITPDMLKGTWLENSRLFEYVKLMGRAGINDIIQYLAAYQKHPNIANLIDDRYFSFAKEYVNGNKALANRLIDWRKVRPHEMLRTQKEELPVLTELSSKGHIYRALFYQKVRAAGMRLTAEQMKTLDGIYNHQFEERPMKDAIKRNRIPKALNYIAAQAKKDKRLRENGNVLYYWRDYLKECDMLGYDLNDDSIYYPPDLMKAHERTMKIIKIQEDEAARAAAKKRIEQLSWMAYRDGDIFIRPAEGAHELKDEGSALSHCVASYADRYLQGKTAIFFIRRAAEPDKSWFTLELNEKDFTVRQNRGLKNCAPPEEVKQFVERWLEWLPAEKARLKRRKKEKAA